jgi:hypothetical protein
MEEEIVERIQPPSHKVGETRHLLASHIIGEALELGASHPFLEAQKVSASQNWKEARQILASHKIFGARFQQASRWEDETREVLAHAGGKPHAL